MVADRIGQSVRGALVEDDGAAKPVFAVFDILPAIPSPEIAFDDP